MFKRKIFGKMPMALLVMLMAVCASAFAGLRDGAWEVNPSEFRYDMSMYFRMENPDFEDLSAVEIGAFVDDECRGVAEKLELTGGETCLYMRIRSNKADGEKLTFLMRDKSTGQVLHVRAEDGSDITFKADSRIGLPSDPLAMEPCFTVVFKIDGELIQTLEVGYGDTIQAPDVPEKEGYTFNGWGDIPAKMPGYDIEIHSSYSVNHYRITFTAGEEEIYSGEVAYGSSIIAPEAPAKEGMTFDGWGDLPETMPAKDLAFTGTYSVIMYNVVYKIDGEVVYTAQASMGQPVPTFDNVPGKTGHTFSGWTTIPASMPARDVEINGSYVVNHYNITFSIGNEVIVSQQLAYGEEIIVPEAPARDGYSFSGWGDVPAAMPASDLSFKGDYSINSYSVVFRIDQDVFKTITLNYGDPIEIPTAPDMEGHTFSGWGEVPDVMPAHDLVFVGTYEDNYYTIIFRIDGEIIKMADLAYESEVIVPEVPAKEGYSFGGWGNVPATMPASNIEIDGTYTLNNYVVTFRIDDEVIYVGELPYGSEILAPEAPEKEGHTFSGWGIVPATVPASDLVISGTYNVNSYTMTFFIDGEKFYTTQVPYGTEISAPEAPAKEGHVLVGWSDMPATMPAYDLNLDGTYSIASYNLVFKIGDEIIFSGEIPYGTEILVPEAPAKEGYSFSGWGMVPATMPGSDLEITGAYDVNIYNLTFYIDGEVLYATTMAYGSEIVPPFIAEEEGKTFSGWGDVPAKMPANDLYINGTYSVNYYLLTFRIGDEVIFSGEVPYGAEITQPAAPEKDGYTFSGWADVPSNMPAKNLDIEGSYNPNSYSLKFMIGGEVVFESDVVCGSEIIAPEAPAKEGYSFTGWGVVPSVMPASDLVITGSYEINSYALVFRIGEEIFYSAQLAYGADISVPDVQEREGYTFSGWGELPKTMPAKDLEITASYVLNSYSIVFKIDGEVVFEDKVEYGQMIMVPEVPDKVGYSFSGWGMVPIIMPAGDLEFSGSYVINTYNITFNLNDEVIYSASLPYGAAIVAPEVQPLEGYAFSGWDDVPETMPDHDVTVNGTMTKITSGVSVAFDAEDEVNVYSIDGVLVCKDVKVKEAMGRLTPGIYVINGKKMVIK